MSCTWNSALNECIYYQDESHLLTVIVAEEEKQQWHHTAAAAALVTVNFFQKGRFYEEGIHFYKVNILFLCIFLTIFQNIFVKIEAS